jgi:hypothetical protein
MEAYNRAMRGDRVSIEGRRKTPGDAESGQADVIDHTQRQAVQMKTVTGDATDAVTRNLQSAIDQLGGDKGEHPPDGFQRIADILADPGHRGPLVEVPWRKLHRGRLARYTTRRGSAPPHSA